MSKNDSSKREREEIITSIEMHFGGTEFKRCASATAGLSTSQSFKKYNGLAHLLCNPKNFPIVRKLLEAGFEVDIPEPFKELNVDITSFMYACGTAPRFKAADTSHVSVDDVKREDRTKKIEDDHITRINKAKRDFVSWCQARRIDAVGGFVGLSRSVASTKEEQRAEWSKEKQEAAAQQEAVYAAVLDGGKSALKTLLTATDYMKASEGIMKGLQDRRAKLEAKLAERAAEKAWKGKKSETPPVVDETPRVVEAPVEVKAKAKGKPKQKKAAPAHVDEVLVQVFEDIAGAAPIEDAAPATKDVIIIEDGATY